MQGRDSEIQQATRRALRAALRVRRSAGVPPWEPVNVFDLAEHLGVEVRFVDIPSLEGVYWRSHSPTIFVSSQRPPGRQAFTCGHELGHHVFGHGARIDEVVHGPRRRKVSSDEAAANAFSSFVLMPRAAVLEGFSRRGWTVDGCPPERVYAVARWLGVGYETLVTQMHLTLGMLQRPHAEKLLKVTVKHLRRAFAGVDVNSDLVPVDASWNGHPVDLRVDDRVLAPRDTAAEGSCLNVLDENDRGIMIGAVAPGYGRLYNHRINWAVFVRVSRPQYVGLNKYRFLEEVGNE